MAVCQVKHCKNNRKFPKPNISFHCFPREESMLKKWLSALEIVDKDWKWLKHKFVCSEHFNPYDFIVYDGRRKVKPNIVPTQKLNKFSNVFNPPTSSTNVNMENTTSKPNCSLKRKFEARKAAAAAVAAGLPPISTTDLDTNIQTIELIVDVKKETIIQETPTNLEDFHTYSSGDSAETLTNNELSSGFRIVEINHLSNCLMDHQRNHTKNGCDGIYKSVYEKRDGLISTFTWRCTICGDTFECKSVNEQKTCPNMAAVAATRECGITYTTANDFLKTIGIPFMSYDNYYDIAVNLKKLFESKPPLAMKLK